MGLTASSTGFSSVDSGLKIEKTNASDKIVALAGNPNVGKSTVFNALTGMKQHTGNWPGKTVTNAWGNFQYANTNYILVDIPGTYSLFAHSAEEEVARDFVCFGNADAVIVVCDATCLERNMNLVLQTMEVHQNVVLCVNLMDEAEKKQIKIDLNLLEKTLGIPVVGASARSGKGLDQLMAAVSSAIYQNTSHPIQVKYSNTIEEAIHILEPAIFPFLENKISPRWTALRLLDYDDNLVNSFRTFLGRNLLEEPAVLEKLDEAKAYLSAHGTSIHEIRDRIVESLVLMAEKVCKYAVTFPTGNYNERDRKLDKILTSKGTGIPVMLILLAAVFWLTITGANYPSEMLSTFLFKIQDQLTLLFTALHAPDWLHGVLVLGMYRVLAWVVAVMLPPMAIFFPLFTLLEDSGYLPRIAFNLDKGFKKCSSCGKQALTMAMGFGCNAAAITGCRIIDSPRERLIAIITNNFVPCNGRFAQP